MDEHEAGGNLQLPEQHTGLGKLQYPQVPGIERVLSAIRLEFLPGNPGCCSVGPRDYLLQRQDQWQYVHVTFGGFFESGKC